MSDAALWGALLGLLGLVLGSFIATVVVRFPGGRSALVGRSACDGCARPLRGWELVPLLSWVVLRGRCSRCGAGIAALHPAVELAGLVIGGGAGLLAPGVAGVAGACFGWLLLLLGAIDGVAYRLPDPLTLLLALAGLVAGLFDVPPPLADRLIGGVAGYASLWIVAVLYRRMRGRDGLGGGDPKLFAGIGLWLGWRALPSVLLVASIAGLAVALARRQSMDDRLPFGTLLALGATLTWAWRTGGGGW
ncbi:leader peptidase (prepilin peptidase) / N-methyltransferase [Sphingomonas guangdongensis]|uniref:Prepilin leader peptidase/N-methyltransferase n=1 Tax=Sphingomonas guangdongensis TaxID=1141890 RepID=A0A285R5T3_9SPHN|nr:A24 family peptidase [Sphingomonas guangdongensis]SOB87712.1 leader peptidase (prepilin peptidase) / N-methyltransferase [Sphingomonas guangdongensis]